MSLDVLGRRSLTLFAAVGGWRTVAEGVASRAVFLIAYVLTGNVMHSALIAVGGVVVLAGLRLFTDRKFWQAAIGLVTVAVSALWAGGSGQAVDFYLPSLLLQAASTAVLLVSILLRWPVVGLAVGARSGDRFGWRRDPAQIRRYQLCTAIFLAKCAIATAALGPLYAAGAIIPLGIASTLLGGAPAAGLCIYLCWRILRRPAMA